MTKIKKYTARMVKKENEPIAFVGKTWYNMKQEYCPVGTCINNTTDLNKAVKFDTKEEAQKHIDFWFVDGAYEVVSISKEVK